MANQRSSDAPSLGPVIRRPRLLEPAALLAQPYEPLLGELVHFWTGRGSHGYAVFKAVRNGRYYLEPLPSAHRGADYWPTRGYWAPRDYGVTLANLTQPPNFWFQNN